MTCRVLIRGRVQGVGYRAFVEDEALLQGIEGWVRNRWDGYVEAVFSGPAEVVEAMIAVCRRGPPTAIVEDVDVGEADDKDLALRPAGESFSVLMTV